MIKLYFIAPKSQRHICTPKTALSGALSLLQHQQSAVKPTAGREQDLAQLVEGWVSTPESSPDGTEMAPHAVDSPQVWVLRKGSL